MAENGRRSPLFTDSPIGIMVLDRKGTVIDVNASGCKELARQKGRLAETPFLEWVLPADRVRARNALERIYEGEAVTWKVRVRRGDGLARLQHFQGSPLRKDGAVEGVLLFFADLPGAGDGRPEIRQLQDLLENLPGQFLLMADKRGRVRYSAGLSRTHFRDSDSVLGEDYGSLLGPEREGEENLEVLLKAVGEGNSWSGVQWHRRKDGVSFPAEIFASPYLDPRTGQVLGVLIVGRDSSPAREWKERARSVQPLAQIGALTARISQEMTRSLDRLERGFSQNGKDVGSSSIAGQELKGELTRMKKLLNGIHEFGDRGSARREAVSLPVLTHEALERAAGRMASMGIQPVVEVPPNLPQAFADPRHVGRILDLLLDNAVEAMDGISTPVLRLEMRNGPDGVILRMTNAGASIDPEWMGEIFDPFFSTKKGHPGLGLAVAKGMAVAQEGRMWVESPQEGFLTLALELLREDPDRVRSFRPTPLNLTRSRTVLVVDDDEAIRGALRSFLEKVGYQVKEAWSGRSALAVLTSGRLPEIVLTDLKMSDGSGYWFMEELSRDFPRLVRRTILITGDADHEAATELAQSTGCPLVRKPFELPELLEILDQVALTS